ncbi:acetyl-CoA C-acetyltransferase [Marinobacter alexandrii]|uniref:acetyl-CoA C-acetyltransferase n=1 Tax=Marinobacter alexandrii TaxID=2570351 RepID=UPI0011084716|nr:acetyl-CoA C-acetyltransferase [Marinobacter alexandrii]
MAQSPKTTQPKTPARATQPAAQQNGVRRVAVLGGNRIPFAKSNTAYSKIGNQELLTSALRGLVDRYGLQGQRLGEVVAGAVIKHSRDFNLTREAALSSGLAPETPAYDIQQACGTGLEAAILVANKIALGQIECGIAGGTDTTSDAPIGVGEGLREILLDLNRAKTLGQRLKILGRFRPGHLVPEVPENGEPRTGMSMGDHAQITAHEWNIAREDQDQLALESHKKLGQAYEDGFFSDLMTPLAGLERDNILRPDTTLEKLASLKPCFDRENGTMTAANSTALTDGASCVLLASEEWAKANNLEVKAWLTFSEVAAVDFVDKKEGLLMAPAYAVPRMLERAGLSLQDFDYYEIHEAFASQVLSTLKAWEDPEFCKTRLELDQPLGSIDRSKLNVKGSSLAAGHPFAATGGRIVATLAKLLEQKGSGRGLISICAAGGQGVTAILER